MFLSDNFIECLVIIYIFILPFLANEINLEETDANFEDEENIENQETEGDFEDGNNENQETLQKPYFQADPF